MQPLLRLKTMARQELDWIDRFNRERGYVFKCAECEIEFVSRRPGAKYCSKVCRDRRNNRVKEEKLKELTCLQCGKKFLARSDRVGSYCRRGCTVLARNIESYNKGCLSTQQSP